ncbi:MAG: hypothetical protein JW754_02360 [Candidatus Aenigmarchaeota archaeon]|nr:hypothetical protein [Candidatus Aenigmarchaeota archaeon]
MSLESLRKGQIVLSFPVSPSHESYVLGSRYTNARFYITLKYQDPMNRYLEKMSSGDQGEDTVFVPCVVTGKPNANIENYQAGLLAPPGTSPKPPGKGMIIPDLKFKNTGPFGPIRFILTSDYRGHEDFSSPKTRMLIDKSGETDILFQGEQQNEGERPGQKSVVYVKSFLYPGDPVFRQNEEMLQKISQSGGRFWWDLEI